MDIEIVDGIELNDKDHQSSFLFRIKSVDSIALTKSVIMEFKDETGEFPADEFQLYKYLYGKKKETVSSDIAVKIKKNYVGKTFKVVAYETGEFTGIPNGYFEYLPVRQDYGFHFRHYIIAVANVTNKTN
ncbi:hypothetical protein [Ferruginibacter sp.]|nr:hypothetical protein [Ferruginibacter sp.]